MTEPAFPFVTPVYSQTAPNLEVGSELISVGARAALEATALSASKRQATVAGLDSLIPVIYGMPMVGAKIANVLSYSNAWIFWVIWGLGPIQSIEEITMDDAPFYPNDLGASTVTNYLGTDAQSSDTTLQVAFGAVPNLPGYNLQLNGIAYSVIVVGSAAIQGMPKFVAKIKGRKVYDPRDGAQDANDSSTWVWSRNPALHLADFLTDPDYGAGKSVNWASVETVADQNDTVIGTDTTEVQRYSDTVIEREATIDNWVETLRTAASCFVVPQGDTVKLIGDVTGTPSVTYAHASGNIISVSGDTLKDPMSLPTVLEVVYTDTSAYPWRDGRVTVKRPGVDAGTTPWRKSTVQMPWITRYSQASREATERLNKLWLRALSFTLETFDEGFRHEPGDLVYVTWPASGYSSLACRVLATAESANGYTLKLEKDDPACYSAEVVANPSVPNTDLPSPLNPPTLTGVGVTEDVYQDQTGRWRSRLIVTWTEPTNYPFTDYYLVTVTTASDAVQTGQALVGGAQFITGPLPEGINYTAGVQIVSLTGQRGTAASASVLTAGRNAPPSDVPSLTAYVLSGSVKADWTAASDLDLSGYELRYSTTGGSWTSSTLIARVAAPALTYTTGILPAGTWRIWIKALDSVRSALYPNGQQSANATYADVDVTINPLSYVAGSGSVANPTLTNMVACAGGWVTSFGETWNSVFTALMDTYTDPLYTYHAAGTSEWLSESFDAGSSVDGVWTASPTYTDLAGTATATMETSPDNATWTVQALTVSVAARYARVRITTTGTVLVAA